MKLPNLSLCCLFFALVLPLSAQNQRGNQNNQNNANNADGEQQMDLGQRNRHKRFWEARLAGGNYMVAINRITSVAQHEYVISNTGTRVVELSVETLGNSLARFYYVEPVGANAPVADRVVDRGRELLDKAGRRVRENVNPVTKEYPTTTHTKMVEYRVQTESAITRLYRSISKAWKDGEGRIVTVR